MSGLPSPPMLRSGAIVVFLQGETDIVDSEAAERELSVLFRSGSTTVFVTGVMQSEDLQKCSEEEALPIPLSGLGNISLSPKPASTSDESLPFTVTASGIVKHAAWPSAITAESLEKLFVPVIMQTGRGLLVSLEDAMGKIIFSPLKEGCLDRVAFTIVGSGRLTPSLSGSRGKQDACAPKYGMEEVEGGTPKIGLSVVFLEDFAFEETPEPLNEQSNRTSQGGDGIKAAKLLRIAGGTSALKIGRNRVALNGSVMPSILDTDGTLPIPVADGTLPLFMLANGATTILIDEEPVTPNSEGTLPFTLESEGRLVVPEEWLVGGTLPFPLAEKLAKMSIQVVIQSGLTLPRGLKGTGKLVFPDSFDGTNPWPTVTPGMLPYVLTGSGILDLADGTWPLPRLEVEDRIIPIKRVEKTPSDTSSEPVHPDDQVSITAPQGTEAGPDPVNPEDLPLTNDNLIDPSKAGPDPVNPEDRSIKHCCSGH